MSSNKRAKEKLIELYGNECFIDKLHLRKDKVRRYTSKGQMKRMRQLTYHHIIERRKGGKATVENGALLSAENHSWFHKQSEQKQKAMNQIFQEYKKSQECSVVFVEDLKLPFKIEFTELSVDEKGKYNRAKKKKEDQEIIDDYWREDK